MTCGFKNRLADSMKVLGEQQYMFVIKIYKESANFSYLKVYIRVIQFFLILTAKK